MHQEHKNTITQNKLNLSTGMVASYDLWSGNGAGLFSKEEDK